jgi:hypothetical protein
VFDGEVSRARCALVEGPLAGMIPRDAASAAAHRAVLEIRTRVLSPEHPHTLAGRDNLAIACVYGAPDN